MDAARWQRIQELFHEAAELPRAEREARVRERAAGDAALAGEVLALLAEDARASSVIDRGLARAADAVLGAPAAPVLPPHDFGPYRIRSVLGEGGMGVVYLAEREDLRSLAAIKVLRDAWLSPARRERFAAEQRTLAQLTHPSIARLYDAGSLPDGTPWIVMEYVEGVPLTEYCRRHATSIEGRLELFRAVCEAVQHAHGEAIIHRDLKPSNILVGPDGSVKLLDFGIAKHLASLDSGSETVTAMRMMTPAYAAPEQLRGGRIGIHTDVYSLGVILYELLAQRRPYDLEDGTSEDAARVRERAPERPSIAARAALRARSSRRAAWADLDVLCLTAMHESPERRYPTVEALIRDVDHTLADEPLEARPDTLGYRLGKLVRRNRATVTAAGAALATIVALLAFYTARLASARTVAQTEAARTARIQRFMLSLFDGGDAAGPAEDLRVLALLERGVQEARALDAEPLVQAELYRTLAGLHQSLGEHARADELYALALERQRALHGDAHAQTADTRLRIGLLRLEQARYEEAERWVREALELTRPRSSPAHAVFAAATAALGQVLEARGDYSGAILANEEAVRLCSESGAAEGAESQELVAALGQLADSHFYAGHYATADEINARVLAATRRIHGDRHPRVADVRINLGASLFDRGRLLEAEAHFRDALSILEEFHGGEHQRVASARTMLGRALVMLQRFDEGVPLLERALATQERVHGPVHPRVASALNELGNAALLQDELDRAEECFGRMLEIYEQVYPDEHYLTATAAANLASVLMEKGEHELAEALFRDAIGIYERTLSPEHLNTGIARIKLGRVLLRQGRPAEAEPETLAGFRIVQAQASPDASWLRSARNDLVAECEALGEHERARAWRDEIEAGE